MRAYLITFLIIGAIVGVFLLTNYAHKSGRQECENKQLKVTNERQNKINSIGNVSFTHKLLVNGLRNKAAVW